MLILDVCAGTGSATQAFKDRGHDVDTLDIVGEHTYVCDVREWHPTKQYDFIWMSPPCTEFSLAKRIHCRDRHPDLSIVKACLRIVSEAVPEHWIMENPKGCLRHFIGAPVITVRYSDYGGRTVKPTDLWGVFPWFFSEGFNIHPTPWDTAFPCHTDKGRMKVPYGLSLAICKALEREHSVLL